MRLPILPAALLLCVAPLYADVLEPANVDARAKVLIHLDVQAMAKTRLFRLLREDPDLEVEHALAEFEDEVGLDLVRDVRSLTVYLNDVDGHWVALLRTGERVDAAIDALSKRPGYTVTVAGERTIHGLREHGNEWFGYLYRSETGNERLFVISENVTALLEAVQVVDGERKNLANAEDAAIDHAPQAGSVLYVSADRGLGELGDFKPAAEVSRLVTGVRFDCGESEEKLFASLRLTTATEKDAQDIQEFAQGSLALASMIAGRADTLGEALALSDVIDALDVRRERAAVHFAFRYSSQELYNGFVSLRGLEGK